MNAGIVLLLVVALNSPQKAAEKIPLPGDSFCNYARIKTSAKPFINVRTAPSTHAPVLQKLPPSAVVYTCDETGSWTKVVFGSGTEPCASTRTQGIDINETARCRSGWVASRYVRVISG